MSNTSNTLESNAMGLEAAKILLDIKAVNFRPDEPYILTSGWASPVYIDCRKLISYPKERYRMMQLAVNMLDNGIGFSDLRTNIKKILNPYFTTKKKGTGLGLAIVNKIINDHNGSINFIALDEGAKTIIKFLKK